MARSDRRILALVDTLTHERLAVTVIVVLAAAFAVRVVAILATRHSFVPQNDSLDYYWIASSLSGGHGFGPSQVFVTSGASAFRGPFYPLVLSALFKVAGETVTGARLLNAVLGTVVVAFVGLIGARLWDRRVGLLAAIIAVVYPPLILSCMSLQYEPLIMVLLLGALLCALRARSGGGWGWFVAVGILIGLASLTREYGFLMGVAVAWIAVSGRPRRVRRPIAAAVGILVLALVVISPWTVRNAVELHSFVPVTADSGYGLAGTFNQVSYDGVGGPAMWRDPLFGDPATLHKVEELAGLDGPAVEKAAVQARERLGPLSPDVPQTWASSKINLAQLDSSLRSWSITFAREHPTYVAKVLFWNTVRMFDLNGWGGAVFVAHYVPYNTKLVKLAVLGWYVALLLSLIGIFWGRAKEAPLALWLMIVLLVITVIPISGNIRYRQPIAPFVVLLAALGVERLCRLAVKRRAGADAAGQPVLDAEQV